MPNVSPTPWLPILALSFALAAAPGLGEEQAVPAARTAMEHGQLREAMVLLEDWLHRSPDDTVARRLLIRLYLDLGQGAGAEREIGRVRAANPPELSAVERADLRVQLGAAWLLQRAFDRVLTDVVAEEIDDPALKSELTAQRGEARLGLGSLDAAEPLLREAQGLDPANARATFGLARLAYAKGDTEVALAQLQQAINAEPGSYQGWEMMGELRYLQGDLDGAERAFTFAVSRSPIPWVLHFKRAMVRIDRNDLDGAAEDIEAAGEAGGKFPGLDLAGGALALRQGDAAGAATQLARYLQAVPGDRQGIFLASLAAARQGHYAQAEDLLKQFRSLSPTDPAGVELQADILLARGQAVEAERVIRPVSGLDGTARAAELLFDALLAQGRREEALVVVEDLSRRFPREPRFALALVDGQFAAGNKPAARAEIARLLREVPDSQRVQLAVARIQLRRGDSVSALAQARALIANHAQVPAVQQLWGDALVATGDAAGARAAYARALELRPGFKPAVAALAKLQSQGPELNAPGVAGVPVLPEDRRKTVAVVPFDPADAEGDYAKLSVESLGQRLATDPKDVRTRVALARRLIKDKDQPAALAVLMAAPAGQTPRPALLRLRGELQLATGSPDQAVLSFEQLFAAYPKNPAPSYLLAMARAAKGDRPRMVPDLERALQMAPGHPLAGSAVDAVLAAEPDDPARIALAARLA
ncbi:MAG TPA: tetratricopeptide repeat protein, partial [Lamprocystis sp. (in: g-proteobacteria)]|nr:tetratricopeptide repeat protein [Lamprocystis sp. (in: g-proteobacteria)]